MKGIKIMGLDSYIFKTTKKDELAKMREIKQTQIEGRSKAIPFGNMMLFLDDDANYMDKMDYEGSMIYDEYPDRFTLERLAVSMGDVLRKEANENMEPIPEDGHFEELIYVLLCNEVYKRRNGKRKSYWIM